MKYSQARPRIKLETTHEDNSNSLIKYHQATMEQQNGQRSPYTSEFADTLHLADGFNPARASVFTDVSEYDPSEFAPAQPGPSATGTYTSGLEYDPSNPDGASNSGYTAEDEQSSSSGIPSSDALQRSLAAGPTPPNIPNYVPGDFLHKFVDLLDDFLTRYPAHDPEPRDIQPLYAALRELIRSFTGVRDSRLLEEVDYVVEGINDLLYPPAFADLFPLYMRLLRLTEPRLFSD